MSASYLLDRFIRVFVGMGIILLVVSITITLYDVWKKSSKSIVQYFFYFIIHMGGNLLIYDLFKDSENLGVNYV